MAKAPRFEDDDSPLVQALKDGAPERVDLCQSVMNRIRERRSLESRIGELRPPQMPRPISFSESVMQRVSQAKEPQRESNPGGVDHAEAENVRSLRWLTHVGAAIAAGLMVALFYGPISEWLSDPESRLSNDTRVASSQDSEVEAESAVSDAAHTRTMSGPMTGQIRSSRDYQGELCWITDLGLVEGVRVGDLFTWYEDDRPAGHLRVIGVSTFASITQPEGRSNSTPQFRAHVETSLMTDAMRRARKRLESGDEGGAFYGLGVVVASGEQGVVVEEVIRELWPTEVTRPQLSPAAKLGLEPGDLVQSVQGQRIVNLADFERALSRVSPEDGVLWVDILRDGDTYMSLHER